MENICPAHKILYFLSDRYPKFMGALSSTLSTGIDYSAGNEKLLNELHESIEGSAHISRPFRVFWFLCYTALVKGNAREASLVFKRPIVWKTELSASQFSDGSFANEGFVTWFGIALQITTRSAWPIYWLTDWSIHAKCTKSWDDVVQDFAWCHIICIFSRQSTKSIERRKDGAPFLTLDKVFLW